MKFTIENAVEKLNTLLTNGGKKPLRLSERTMKSHVENLMALIANDEMELDDFVQKIKPMMESVNGNAEADQSAFVQKYKNEHPETPKPGEKKPSEKDDEPSEFEKILKRLEAMEKKESEREAARSLETKKADIVKYLRENNVKDKDWIDKMMSLTSISDTDTVEDKGKSLLEVYNLSHSAEDFPTPGIVQLGGDGGSDVFAGVKALRKSRTSEEE